MYYQNRGTSARSAMKPRASATRADRTTETHAALPPVQRRGRIFIPARPPLQPDYTTEEEEEQDFADDPPSGRPGPKIRGAIDYRRRASATQDQTQAPPSKMVAKYEPPRRFGKRGFLYLGLGAASTLALSLLFNKAGEIKDGIWGQWTYGPDPRTFHIDAVVGHNDSSSKPSHFIAINWHGTAILEEWPGGDYTKSIRYVGPHIFVDKVEDQAVILQFRDLNHDGVPDMIIQFADQAMVMINDGTQFRAPKPGESYSI